MQKLLKILLTTTLPISTISTISIASTSCGRSTIHVTNVNLDENALFLTLGGSYKLTPTILPEDASNKNVFWMSKDASIVAVDQKGNVKAVSEGTTTIAVTTKDGNKADFCEVTVTKNIISVQSVELNKNTLFLGLNSSYKLIPTILPEDATNKNVTWKSSNESVATVDKNGNINAVSEGTATITVTTKDGNKTNSCTINVTNEMKLIKIPSGTKSNDFWFSPSFFCEPSTTYSQSLATASVRAINSADQWENGVLSQDGDTYIKDLITSRMQFDNYEQIGYRTETARDSIGLSFGCKTYNANFFNDDYNEKTTLIFMPVRSFSYNREWADNLFIGNGNETRTITGIDGNQYTFTTLFNNHAGFNLSAQVIINCLKLYIEKYNIEGRIKLWLCGFSRGGAVANNAAGILDNAIYNNNLNNYLDTNKISLTKENIYTYTFASPLGACVNQTPNPKSEVYNNIFNCVDPNDIVTCLAPKQWGFTRYGTDRYTGTRLFDPNFDSDYNLRRAKMDNFNLYEEVINFKQYKTDGSVNTEEFKNVTPQAAWNSLLSAVVENVPTRSDYVANWQNDAIELVVGIMSGGSASDYWTKFISKISSLNDARIISWLVTIFRGGTSAIDAAHCWDNYQSMNCAADPLYATSGELLKFHSSYTYYQIYTRVFDVTTLYDLNYGSKQVYHVDTNPTISNEVPYANMVGVSAYNYTVYPPYIEAQIPAGHYNLAYKKSASIKSTGGFVKVSMISSNSLNDEVKYFDDSQSLWPFIESDTFFMDLVL